MAFTANLWQHRYIYIYTLYKRNFMSLIILDFEVLLWFLDVLRRHIQHPKAMFGGNREATRMAGWWFGTMDWIMTFQLSHHIGECHHPNWRTPSFFRGVGIPPTISNNVKLIKSCLWTTDKNGQAAIVGMSKVLLIRNVWNLNQQWWISLRGQQLPVVADSSLVYWCVL